MMTTETNEVLYTGRGAATGDNKPIKEFRKLATMPAGTKIEGRLIGKFESKKNPGSHFYLLEGSDGEVYGYGTCTVLDERVAEFKKVATELNQPEDSLRLSVEFHGRQPTKTPGRTAYKFGPLQVTRPKQVAQ